MMESCSLVVTDTVTETLVVSVGPDDDEREPSIEAVLLLDTASDELLPLVSVGWLLNELEDEEDTDAWVRLSA